jgi:eukaryotic-like serine/threonine-protein kinase
MKECPACKLCFPDDVQRCPNDGDPTNHTILGEPVLDSRYQLIKRLGQGGMGVVYKARHSYLKTAHAIKVILPDLVGNDPNLITRFRQEALAAAAIRHRNIVSVTDFGVVAGKMPFLVMEYVEGESLHDLLVREKRLQPSVALELLSAICSGLTAAHRQDIVHRDLKPLNIMISRGMPFEEAVKLLDFGLAKIKSGELLGSFIQAQTTGLMGSPYYMAPEQWSDDEPDARADVYSLGVILYQMLAGDVPFKGTSIPSIMRKHLSDPPPALKNFGVQLPPSIEEVVRHALEKEPENRTPTAARLVEELRAALANRNAAPVVNLDATAANLDLKENKPTENKQTSRNSAATSVSKIYAKAGEPSATLRVLTNPPQSLVFLDGDKLGASEASGWLVAENIRRGKHRLRVVKDGFAAWESDVICDGEMCQTVAQLSNLAANNLHVPPKNEAAAKTMISAEAAKPTPLAPETGVAQTNVPRVPDFDLSVTLAAEKNDKPRTGDAPAAQPFAIKSYPGAREPENKLESKPQIKREATPPPIQNLKTFADISKTRRDLEPFAVETHTEDSGGGLRVLPYVAAFAIGLLIVSGGGYLVYNALFPPKIETQKEIAQTQDAPPQLSPTTQQNLQQNILKPEMVKIEGGKFMMGVNDGQDEAEPAHEATVDSFWMDKFEVTNVEYAQFVAETGHRPPGNWKNGKFLPEDEKLPVTSVSLEDARDFAKWRSKRDNIEYRLPFEKEWEYAARNGADAQKYPWGNAWQEGKAVMGRVSPLPVGSAPEGSNKWGVQDLIGNAWEWTDSPFEIYPGNKELVNKRKGGYSIRGGSYYESSNDKRIVDSVLRSAFDPMRREDRIGFRLVRSDS